MGPNLQHKSLDLHREAFGELQMKKNGSQERVPRLELKHKAVAWLPHALMFV